MNAQISFDPQRLEAFCRKWKVAELDWFGSVLRDDFTPGSDVDLLATFAPEASWSLLDHVQMEAELRELLGRPVDLVSRRAIERSPNWLRRDAILKTATPCYVAR